MKSLLRPSALQVELPYQVVVREVHGGHISVSPHAGPEKPGVAIEHPSTPQDVHEQEVRVYLKIKDQQRPVVVQRPQPKRAFCLARGMG